MWYSRLTVSATEKVFETQSFWIGFGLVSMTCSACACVVSSRVYSCRGSWCPMYLNLRAISVDLNS